MHDNILCRFDRNATFQFIADDIFANGIGGGPADNNSRSVCAFLSLIINYFRSNDQLYDFFAYLVWYTSQKDYLTVKGTQNLF